MNWDLSKGYRVYRNFTAHNWTVQAYVIGVGWRKFDFARSLVMDEVTFTVSEAGRQRCLREHRKNVHAFAHGRLVSVGSRPIIDSVRVSYNPYRAPTFTTDQGVAVTAASTAHLFSDGAMRVRWKEAEDNTIAA